MLTKLQAGSDQFCFLRGWKRDNLFQMGSYQLYGSFPLGRLVTKREVVRLGATVYLFNGAH